MWSKATYCYGSASVAALVVGSLWAFSQAASAAVVISGEDFTGNAPLTPVVTPSSSSGNFTQTVTGSVPGERTSPYINNTDGNTNAPYSVLGPAQFGGPGPFTGTATYNINAPAVELLWGSPDLFNGVEFFSGQNGMGSPLGTFNGTNLACFSTTCDQTDFDLVTFTDTTGTIGSVVLSNSINGHGNSPAFEFGGPTAIPLPPAIYLFGSVLGGAFWLGRRKRSTVSSLGAA